MPMQCSKLCSTDGSLEFPFRFGNVMILSSPSWSESSPQFTHGFPRKLISAEYGGFLPGNVICTAKATNQAIRRIATEDIACLVSRESIAGAGFTMANLVNCRYAALRYRTTCYIPDYLVTGMLRTGVNFCTFEKIEGKQKKNTFVRKIPKSSCTTHDVIRLNISTYTSGNLNVIFKKYSNIVSFEF